MDTQTQAQLYLADQRGHSQLDYVRSFHSFNTGSYYEESRQPFGSLHLLNDDTLMPGRTIQMRVEANTDCILFPVVGGLEYTSPLGHNFLEAGQVQILSLRSGMSYEITNPYATEWINFIQIWLTPNTVSFTAGERRGAFNLADKNKLHPFLPATAFQPTERPHRGFIGCFDGRTEANYHLSDPTNEASLSGVFVFVLSGVFEVQHRLLHERDGMALLAVQDKKVAFEALSNNAILLLLEIRM